jgi:hypothetical protein
MEDNPYNKRELDHFLGDMKEQLNRIEKDGKETRFQSTKTNGRVTNLELWRAQLQGAGTVAKIGWSILGVFIIAASFALFKMYVQFQSIESKINASVEAMIQTSVDVSVAQSFEKYLRLNGYDDLPE